MRAFARAQQKRLCHELGNVILFLSAVVAASARILTYSLISSFLPQCPLTWLEDSSGVGGEPKSEPWVRFSS